MTPMSISWTRSRPSSTPQGQTSSTPPTSAAEDLTLLEALRSGEIREGERVVLVVTGAGLKPHGHAHRADVREVSADVESVLSRLGVRE